jgi:T5orf172 domain
MKRAPKTNKWPCAVHPTAKANTVDRCSECVRIARRIYSKKCRQQRRGTQILQGDKKRRYVYFVQGEKTGLLKIGCSSDVQRRLRDMQGGSPDVLRVIKVFGPICQAYRIEQAFHDAFTEHRKHGEWFTPDKALLAYVNALRV